MPPKKAGPGNRRCIGLQCGERSKNEGNLYYSYAATRCERACKDPTSPLCDRCIKEKTGYEMEGITGLYHGNYDPNTDEYTIRNPHSKLKGSEWHKAMKAKSAAKIAKTATTAAVGGAGASDVKKTEKAVKEVKKAVDEAVDAAKAIKASAETPAEVKKARATVSKVKTEVELALEKAKEAMAEAKRAAVAEKERLKAEKEAEKAKKEEERKEREAAKQLKSASKAAGAAASAVVDAAETFSEGRIRRNAVTVKRLEKLLKSRANLRRTARAFMGNNSRYRRPTPPNTMKPYTKRSYSRRGSRVSNSRRSPLALMNRPRTPPAVAGGAGARVSNATPSLMSSNSRKSNSTGSVASNFGNIAF